MPRKQTWPHPKEGCKHQCQFKLCCSHSSEVLKYPLSSQSLNSFERKMKPQEIGKESAFNNSGPVAFGASSESGFRVPICPFKLSSLHIEVKDVMNKSIPKNQFF